MTYKKLTDKKTKTIIEDAIKSFRGQLPTLHGAIGCLYTGQQFGWKILYLVHDKKTIKKYEAILGVKFRDVFPEVGELAHKSLAWKLAQKVSNFWKAVSGEISGIRSPEIK